MPENQSCPEPRSPENVADRMQGMAALSLRPLADTNTGRQQNCGLGSSHCTNSSHQQSLTHPGV